MKSERERQIYYLQLLISGILNGTSECIYKTEIVIDIENKLTVTKAGKGDDRNLGLTDTQIGHLYTFIELPPFTSFVHLK